MIVAEVPTLEERLIDTEELARAYRTTAWRCYSECEVRVQEWGGLAAIDRLVNFQTDVEVLTCKVIHLV